MVVRVVVRECALSLGELKVLPAPRPSMLLKAPPAVVVVAALLCPASLLMVPGCVATVGAPLWLLPLCPLRPCLVLFEREM